MKKRNGKYTRLGAGSIFFLGLFIALIFIIRQEEPDKTKNQSYSLLQIEKGNLSGSGVIRSIEEDYITVVTAAHVLEAEGCIQLTLPGGERCREPEQEFWNCYLSANVDVAFIRIPAEEIGKDILAVCQGVSVNKEAFDRLSGGDKIQIIGAGQASGKDAVEAAEQDTVQKIVQVTEKDDDTETSYGTIIEPWIYLEDYGQYMMLIKGRATAGMSGAGVFDEQGNFAGIISGMDEQGNLAVVPLSVILAEEVMAE